MITLVITGVGGPLGQALIKAARLSAVPCRVVGTDSHPLSVGLHRSDRAHLLPRADEPERYLAAMQRLCAEEQAPLILPGSDSELVLLATNAAALREAAGATVVASSPHVLALGLDKGATSNFLERHGLNFPRTVSLEDPEGLAELVREFGFPLVAKPVHGSGSRSVTHVRSWSDLDHLRTTGIPMVVQEYLQPDDEEYSVEVYTLKDGRQAGAISYRRGQLIAGDTYKARVMPHDAAQEEARAVAAALGAAGPCNVQLRVTERGPVTFEINPRFSGGVSMRAHFGYNEVEMAIRDLVRDEPVPEPKITSGRALRFWEELYLDDKPEPAEAT